MSKTIKISFLLFFLLYLFLHFYTLSLNPLPWRDEVFFASISKSFMESGTYIPQVVKELWYGGEECFIYGPIHFFLESMSFKIFGFNIPSYRWVTLIFGMLTIAATANLIRQYNINYKVFFILIVAFAFDPFINLSMHEGRMDLVATLFILIGIDFLLKGLKQNKNIFFIWSGFFSVTALLTTPRIGIIFVAMGIVFLFSLEGRQLKKSLLQLSLWSLPILSIYLVWIFYAFGGVGELINYYKNLQETNGDYVGGRFYIPRHEYVLIALTILSVFYGIYRKGKFYFNPLIFISLISIFLFYIIVLDWGPYSAIILPFYYILLFYGFDDLNLNFRNFPVYISGILFFFNLSFFSLKNIQVFSEKENHDFVLADQFIQKNIPPGSKVIGDPQYYYSVIKGGSDYRWYDLYLSTEERERILREDFDYDYIIITEWSKIKEPELVDYFLRQAKLKKVAVLKSEQSELSKAIEKLGLISSAEKNGYDAEIYVRIKDGKFPMALY